MFSSVACPVLLYYCTLSHKRQDFREKVIEHKMCDLIFSTTFFWNSYHSKTNWARSKMFIDLHVHYPLFLTNLKKLRFSRQIFEKHSHIKFHENPSSGSRVLWGRTDRHRSELSYLAPLDSENISAPYFKQCFFRGRGVLPLQTESNTTPPSPKTEITNILFYILNFASIIKF